MVEDTQRAAICCATHLRQHKSACAFTAAPTNHRPAQRGPTGADQPTNQPTTSPCTILSTPLRCATTSLALRGATASSFFTAYAVFLSRQLARQISSLTPVQLAVGALVVLRRRTARSLLRLDRRTYRREPSGRGVELAAAGRGVSSRGTRQFGGHFIPRWCRGAAACAPHVRVELYTSLKSKCPRVRWHRAPVG